MSRLTRILRPRQPGWELGPLSAILSCSLIAACGADNSTAPLPPPPPPTSGSVAVVTRTLGEALDPDGYAIRIDDTPVLTSPSNGTSEITGIALGTHSLRLADVAANCSLTTSNPQNVVVASEGPVEVTFGVHCAAWAVLEISVVTSGGDPDPDGYGLYLDGEPGQPVEPDTTLRLDRGAGTHTLSLGDLASNCSVTGVDPLELSVAPGDTAGATFGVICTSFSAGRIVVTTHTSGTFTDPDGYSVSLDGGTARAIGTAETVIFSEVAPGTHSVKLTGMSPGCGFWLANPKRISVIAGAAVNVSFDVLCIP